MIIKMIICIVTLSLIHLTSSDCIQYKDKQCLKCSQKMTLKEGKCWTLIIQKKQIPSPNSLQQQNLNDITYLSSHRDQNKKAQTLKNALPFQLYNNQLAENKQIGVKQEPNTSLKLTRISQRSSLGDPLVSNEISIDDVMSSTTNSTYIRQIYSDLSNQIINQQLNRISLQFFDFSKMRSFDQDYDTVLQQIHRRNEQLLKNQMKCKILLAVYYKYNLPIKTYKLFYTQRDYLNSVPLFCIESIINLFSHQIYTSQFSVYSNITIAPNVLLQIRSQTKGR